MHIPGSSLLGLLAAGVIVVSSGAFVLQRSSSYPPHRTMELISTSGALSITSSREGEAILSAAPMLPGTQATGTVAIANTGHRSESMTLDAGAPVDQRGPGGGKLSSDLQLRVEDISAAGGAPEVVYAGPLTGLHLASLGMWAAGERRTYRFVVTFPDGGAGGADNAYQGSSTSIAFHWTAADGGSSPPSPASRARDQSSGSKR
jgi:hypothetical protein